MTIMKKITAAALGLAVLGTVSIATSTRASAKHLHHHHNHWRGGPIVVLGDAYPSDCYLVKKYRRSGKPYFVEVCS
jgi:hypothetical protein